MVSNIIFSINVENNVHVPMCTFNPVPHEELNISFKIFLMHQLCNI